MKKTITVIAFLFVVALSVTFGQTTADEWIKKADEFFEKKDYANAVTAYSEAIKRDNTNLNSYFGRGLSYHNLKNYDAAIADYNKVISGKPEFANSYYVLGDIYYNKKDYDAAINYYSTAIKYAPNFSFAYINRGYNYVIKGLYQKAIADYRTGLDKGFDPSGFPVNKTNKAEMWFCGAIYMEIVVNRFLGKNDVVTKYENWLKTVCDKNNVTRAEVEAFYRDNIRALIADVVNEKFNNILFAELMDRTYQTTLIRDPQSGKYTLSYFRPSRKDDVKEIKNLTLDALLDAMDKNSLNLACINEVKKQAGLFPAIKYAELKKQGNADALELVIEAVTNFYVNPSQDTYNTLVGISARLFLNMLSNRPALRSYNLTLREMSKILEDRISDQVTRGLGRDAPTLARYPADKRYDVFGK